jgi:hypothetical protein
MSNVLAVILFALCQLVLLHESPPVLPEKCRLAFVLPNFRHRTITRGDAPMSLRGGAPGIPADKSGDLYALLDVTVGSTADEIKAAYRSICSKHTLF